MSNKSVGLKNIAFALNISVNTVSRALRDCSDISKSTKELVKQKANELGYKPKNFSHFIKREGQFLFGIILPNKVELETQLLLNILNQELPKKEMDYIFIPSDSLNKSIIKQCQSLKVDGIISLVGVDDDVISLIKRNNFPIVLLGLQTNQKGLSYVCVNNEKVGQMAAKHLTNFHKVRKMICIREYNCTNSNIRIDAFQEYVSKNLTRSTILVLEPKDINPEFIKHISDGYYGIFAYNDSQAYQILRELKEKSYDIRSQYPDFHIIGVGALHNKIVGLSDLTSLDVDYKMLVVKAIDILRKKIISPNSRSKNVLLEPKLYIRKSL